MKIHVKNRVDCVQKFLWLSVICRRISPTSLHSRLQEMRWMLFIMKLNSNNTMKPKASSISQFFVNSEHKRNALPSWLRCFDYKNNEWYDFWLVACACKLLLFFAIQTSHGIRNGGAIQCVRCSGTKNRTYWWIYLTSDPLLKVKFFSDGIQSRTIFLQLHDYFAVKLFALINF